MDKVYGQFWAQMNGIEGWNLAKEDIKELVTNPLLWAIKLIDYATQTNKELGSNTGMNEAAWQRINVALDVLKWLHEKQTKI